MLFTYQMKSNREGNIADSSLSIMNYFGTDYKFVIVPSSKIYSANAFLR